MVNEVFVSGMAADPDGKFLYVGIDAGGVVVYKVDPNDGHPTLAWVPPNTPDAGSGGPLPVAAIAVHPSGKFLYTQSLDGSVYGYAVAPLLGH